MYLVYEKKNLAGKWAVAWMCLPHFLAADRELHKLVDQTMTEEFRGTIVDSGEKNSPPIIALVEKLNNRVIALILEKYPIRGLRHLLDTYAGLEPGEKFDELQQ